MVGIQTLGMHERHRGKNNELVFRIASGRADRYERI